MRNFQDTFETRKRSSIRTFLYLDFSVLMIAPSIDRKNIHGLWLLIVPFELFFASLQSLDMADI